MSCQDLIAEIDFDRLVGLSLRTIGITEYQKLYVEKHVLFVFAGLRSVTLVALNDLLHYPKVLCSTRALCVLCFSNRQEGLQHQINASWEGVLDMKQVFVCRRMQ